MPPSRAEGCPASGVNLRSPPLRNTISVALFHSRQFRVGSGFYWQWPSWSYNAEILTDTTWANPYPSRGLPRSPAHLVRIPVR
jgi:hypothetical protein